MNYLDIFMLGWNLNAAMFVVNLFLAVNIIRPNQLEEFEKQKENLDALHKEFISYYPNRKAETIISYFIPFTAFYRISFKLLEMLLFLNKNKGSKIYDYVIYKYQSDIEKAKNR